MNQTSTRSRFSPLRALLRLPRRARGWLLGPPIFLLVAGVLAVAALVAQISQGGSPAVASHTGSMWIDPAASLATEGQFVTLKVMGQNAPGSGGEGLGAFGFRLQYPATKLQFLGFAEGPYLGSTFRATACIVEPPVISLGQGTVGFACSTAGSTPTGPIGQGVLASVSFQALLATEPFEWM